MGGPAREGSGRLGADENDWFGRPGNPDSRSLGCVPGINLLTLADRVLVLHAFQKKTQQTPEKDIDLAARRLREWKG
jgi:hypothetical protein